MKRLLGCLFLSIAALGNAAVVPLSDSIVVSDATTPGALGGVVLSGLAPGPYVARSRQTINQNTQQLVTFFQYDLSTFTPADTLNPLFSASFSIDFLGRLNTLAGNDLTVSIGRNVNGAWTSSPGTLPLHDWGFEDGDGAPPSLPPADGITLVNNVRTDAFGTINVDVTNIVSDWINGTPNNGFVLYYNANVFQGARFDNVVLDVVVPEPGTMALAALLLPIGVFYYRKRRKSALA